jgi:hypothetical protein
VRKRTVSQRRYTERECVCKGVHVGHIRFYWQNFTVLLFVLFLVSCIAHVSQYYQLSLDQDDAARLKKRLPSELPFYARSSGGSSIGGGSCNVMSGSSPQKAPRSAESYEAAASSSAMITGRLDKVV